jgi:hypothetical protein
MIHRLTIVIISTCPRTSKPSIWFNSWKRVIKDNIYINNLCHLVSKGSREGVSLSNGLLGQWNMITNVDLLRYIKVKRTFYCISKLLTNLWKMFVSIQVQITITSMRVLWISLSADVPSENLLPPKTSNKPSYFQSSLQMLLLGGIHTVYKEYTHFK